MQAITLAFIFGFDEITADVYRPKKTIIVLLCDNKDFNDQNEWWSTSNSIKNLQ